MDDTTYRVRFMMIGETFLARGCTEKQYRNYMKKCQGDEPFVVETLDGWFVVNPAHLQYMHAWTEPK